MSLHVETLDLAIKTYFEQPIDNNPLYLDEKYQKKSVHHRHSLHSFGKSTGIYFPLICSISFLFIPFKASISFCCAIFCLFCSMR